MRKDSKLTLLTFLGLLLVGLSSCVPSENNGGGGRSSSRGGTANNTFSVSPNNGRYLTDNPVVLSGDDTLDSSVDLSRFLSPTQTFITENQFLIAPCGAGGASLSQCFEVRKNETSGFITATENRWAFPTTTDEFLQVQTFGNMRDIMDKFHDNLEFSYNLARGYGYPSALPSQLFTSDDNAYWFKNGVLKGYADCGVENNAFYDPAGNIVCMGAIVGNDQVVISPPLKVASDPQVTWHEMGHAFNKVNVNIRQRSFEQSILQETDLGYLFYDEAGSINEGLADFYSFFMNKKTIFAEWALGRYLRQARPISESEDIHAPGFSETASGRLSYPQFVTYDPNEPDVPFEDVHYSGQIASHFFHAFYKSLMDTNICGLSSDNALKMTMHLVFETLAEVGDQTATGYGNLSSTYNVNLNPTNAIEWISKARPITYRRFFQVYSKYFLQTLGNPLYSFCNGREYYRDDYEKLLDSYGLLLFKTYNENGNGTAFGHTGTNTTVTPTNRVKSQLIPKDLLILDQRENAPSAFVIDSQSDVKNAIESLLLGGRIASISSEIDSNFAYNNGNAKVSPGEVVGLAINLFNNSNSTMGGVRVLANDWDHTKAGAPCNNLGDNFPLDSEGAAQLSSGEGAPGGCDWTTRFNGKEPAETGEELAPVCLVELNDDDSTKWVTQDKLRVQMGLPKKRCLGGENETTDCFIRAIKGADHAFYSKLDPQKTWAETLITDEGVPTFNTSNVIFMEVSPSIPPGTTFNCRLRASFTNCEDCHHDATKLNDDYLDYEFSGARPFKLINFRFTVID